MLNILSSTYYIIINIIIIVSDQAPLSLKIFMYQLEIEPFSTVRLMFLWSYIYQDFRFLGY